MCTSEALEERFEEKEREVSHSPVELDTTAF
jgi:hypothetical protein